jgi:hypothetical protein
MSTTEIAAIATAILDLLKALMWPVTILVIVLIFRSHLKRILEQFADRLSALKEMGFGSARASFAVDELAKLSSDPQTPQSERRAIDQHLEPLSDPLTDGIALKLWRRKSGAAQITRELLEPTRLSGERFSPGFMRVWTLRVKKILDALEALQYVHAEQGEYELTDAGRAVFKEVVEQHESDILDRFKEARLSI